MRILNKNFIAFLNFIQEYSKLAGPDLLEDKIGVDKKMEKDLENLKKELKKLELEKAGKNKTVAVGTSRLNYLDPRISVAW